MNKVSITMDVNENGKKIPLITFWRWIANSGLKDAKDFIEDLQMKSSGKATVDVDTR